MRLKPIRFPSANFPGADLRLYSDTTYTFICLSCGASVDVPFGWGTQPQLHPSDLSRVERNAVIDHFARARKLPRGEQYERVGCPSCGTEYVLAFQVEETSFGAARLVVVDAVQMEAVP